MNQQARRHSLAPELLDGPPRYRARSPWGVMMALIATALVIAIPLLLTIIGISVWSALSAPEGASGEEIGDTIDTALSLAKPEGALITALGQLASLALVLGFASWRGARRDVLAMTGEGFSLRTYVVAGLAVIVATGLLELVLYGLLKFDVFADTAWLAEGLRSPWGWATVVIAVVLAPVWEELTFRGFLLSALAQTRLGFWGGALVSNVLWSALHGAYSLPGLISVFVAGLVLSWIVWRTGSIKPAIITHAVANAFAVAFTYAFAPTPI
jgi:membrane protease YdiL (CAAX protease family)